MICRYVHSSLNSLQYILMLPAIFHFEHKETCGRSHNRYLNLIFRLCGGVVYKLIVDLMQRKRKHIKFHRSKEHKSVLFVLLRTEHKMLNLNVLLANFWMYVYTLYRQYSALIYRLLWRDGGVESEGGDLKLFRIIKNNK